MDTTTTLTVESIKQRKYIVTRSTIEGEESYLFVRTITTKKIIPAKNQKWAEHNLIHAKDAGNGYHGRCGNCGSPLITYLGGSSWDGTVCQVNTKEKEVVNIEYKFGWTKFRNRATSLTKDDAHKHRWSHQSAQGWGKYNFHDGLRDVI